MAKASTTKPTNDEEAAAMREGLAAYDADRAQEQQAELNAERTAMLERLQPLRDFVDSVSFQEVADVAKTLTPDFADIDAINVHLQYLAPFMGRLRDAVDRITEANQPAQAVVPHPAPPESAAPSEE